MKNKRIDANRHLTTRFALSLLLGSFLLLAGSVSAQYGDSYSRMLDMTRTWNQNLWDDQKRLTDITNRNTERGSSGRTAVPPGYVQVPASPGPPPRQYPITATDFISTGSYVLPDQLADGIQGLSNQDREESRKLFKNILTSFENGARKNNMANALAFITAISLQTTNGGKALTNAQENVLIAYYNNALANTQQYNAFSSQQKQVLYECLVITGGVIAFLHAKGSQLNNPQLEAQSQSLSKAVLKHFLGINIQ